MAGKILIPVDFSPFTESMLGCAQELAQAGLDEVIVAHVMGEAPSSGPNPHAEREMNEGRLEELARQAGEQGLEVRTRLLTGHPAGAVLDAARQEDVDLILVGSHGWGFFHRHIPGSVADKIVRLADRPVLVFKCRVKEKKGGYDCVLACPRLLECILVANDFSDYADRVRPALDRFAQAFCTRVVLLHVQEGLDVYGGEVGAKAIAEDARENMERLVEMGGEMGPYCEKVETHAITGEPVPRILQAAGDVGASLIVVGAMGRHKAHGDMIGGVAEKILRRSEVPVMVLKAAPEGGRR
jgi:nucleotide-binding universal stress UspA family protein